MYFDYAIIGAGIAGLKAAQSIRNQHPTGSILLVNGEDRLPYKRTRISKAMAKGFDADAFALHDELYFQEMNISYKCLQISSIDVNGKCLFDRHGGAIHWNKLLLCTGSNPVFPAFDREAASFIFPVRTALDVETIVKKLKSNRKIAIIGGGVLGVEVAEQLTIMGHRPYLYFAGSHLLETYLDSFLSEKLANELHNSGVRLFPQHRIMAIENSTSDVCALVTDAGDCFSTDLIISCIGSRPNVLMAMEAGIPASIGIKTDWKMCCQAPDVYAAGDVVQLPDGRVEGLWHAAEYQGMIAGTNAAGGNMVHDKRGFRMKLESQNSFYFSQIPVEAADSQEIWKSSDGTRYYKVFFLGNQLSGALMWNDAARAKILQKAIWEGWDRKMVAESFFVD